MVHEDDRESNNSCAESENMSDIIFSNGTDDEQYANVWQVRLRRLHITTKSVQCGMALQQSWHGIATVMASDSQ